MTFPVNLIEAPFQKSKVLIVTGYYGGIFRLTALPLTQGALGAVSTGATGNFPQIRK